MEPRSRQLLATEVRSDTLLGHRSYCSPCSSVDGEPALSKEAVCCPLSGLRNGKLRVTSRCALGLVP